MIFVQAAFITHLREADVKRMMRRLISIEHIVNYWLQIENEAQCQQ